jgi:hypothetical protein
VDYGNFWNDVRQIFKFDLSRERSMYLRCVFLLLAILFGNTLVLAQKKPVRKRVPASGLGKTVDSVRTPNYQLRIKVIDESRYIISIVSPTENGDINPQDLHSLIRDLPDGADKYNRPSNRFPKVVFDVSPNVTMLSLWNPITLFRQDRTDISLILYDGDTPRRDILLKIPWTSSQLNTDIKPNPLLLIVTCDDKGNLSLNNEPAGTIREPRPLSELLLKVFRDREVNGIFRTGLNEIEKTVTIVMPMSSRKVADLFRIAKAVWESGGEPITIEMDSPLKMFVD